MAEPNTLDEDDLFGDLGEGIEEDTTVVKKRGKQAYKEATVRPPTRIEALASEVGDDLFGDIIDADKPALKDIYLDMAGLHKVRATNGLRYIGSFNGCGGSSTGFAWAGWKCLMWIEFVKAARETLAANYPSTMVEPEDVHAYVVQWLKDHEDLGVDVRFNKTKTNRGVKHPETVNWEETLEAAALSGDQKQMEAVQKLRYDSTLALLQAKIEPDKTVIWGDDIRGLDGAATLVAFGLKPGDLDCYEGSPPCKSFSTSGLREEGWGQVLHYSDERDQRTDDLFLEYVRLLKDFQPRSFIAENVAGMGMGAAAEDVMIPLLEEFDRMGYIAEARPMNSKDYSVPQSRPRMIFQGVRKGLVNPANKPVRPTWPDPSPHSYTVGDALEAAGRSTALEVGFAWLGSMNSLKAALDGEPVPEKVQKEWRKSKEGATGFVGDDDYRYETGKIWDQLPEGGSPENKAYQLVRCHRNLPSPTITATSAENVPAAGACHPYENRKFTVNELRWIFSFPHDYVFTGTLGQQGERMGRSVTPYMMKQIAGVLASALAEAEYVEEAA